KKKKPLTFKLKEPKWAATIRPGTYDMQVRSFDDRGVPGDWSPKSELVVKLPAIIATHPKPGTIIHATEEKNQNITVTWEPIPEAIKYRIYVKSTTTDWKQEQDVTNNSV